LNERSEEAAAVGDLFIAGEKLREFCQDDYVREYIKIIL
jgi:hypothetical protein